MSVATKLTCSSLARSESNTTTGILACVAACTGAFNAVSLSGASTMPDTPCATKLETTSTCALRSSSLSGPFQTMSTSSSREAFTAPACTLFQNSCVVPFGTTAMRRRAPLFAAAPVSVDVVPDDGFEHAARAVTAKAHARTRTFIGPGW